ncbi:MAG: hypothetical protein KIT11_02215 [Fimbriimonadaceae bacterium]|nr:hypothetical protein [Fimbriimonadaceae bacterium]QYK54817.1 MAG: hypothetical protein KF733_07320 [Fimbriimonadaceae bacterium]
MNLPAYQETDVRDDSKSGSPTENPPTWESWLTPVEVSNIVTAYEDFDATTLLPGWTLTTFALWSFEGGSETFKWVSSVDDEQKITRTASLHSNGRVDRVKSPAVPE